jgi:DNA repair exonuclease SbcCD nuclease subunit
MHTGIWTARQFRRLERSGIPVCLIRGNHDAESKVRTGITWPENVYEFSVRQPQTLSAADLGLPESVSVALHGQGFAKPDVQVDLAAEYPDAVAGCFNIGVLHTSLTGDPAHDPYAPTSVEVLRNRGYDYWALGHIHKRSDPPISQTPYVAYSGNIQGRHIREEGAKGCLLVTVEDGRLNEVEFREVDTLRWHRAEVRLDRGDGIGELHAHVRDALADCHNASDGRFSAVRVRISGACAAHRELVDAERRNEAAAQIRNLADEWDDEIWIEKIQFDTSAPLDVDRLRQGSDLLGELLRDIQSLSKGEDDLAELVSETLTALAGKTALQLRAADIDLIDPHQLQTWLHQAEGLLLARLEAEA